MIYLKRVNIKFDKYIKDKRKQNIKSQKLETNVLKNVTSNNVSKIIEKIIKS